MSYMPPEQQLAAAASGSSVNHADMVNINGTITENNSNGNLNINNKNAEDDNSNIWFHDDWELTWPIWHMLPRDERKALALKYGYNTIGEFEEFMSMQRGLTDSAEATTTTATVKRSSENALAYPQPPPLNQQPGQNTHASKAKQKNRDDDDGYDDDDDQSDSDEKLEAALEVEEQAERAELGDMTTQELLEVGGKILLLPEEMLHRIFEWLPVDTYASLALVSPHWKSFTRTETVYKKLCERLYLNQSKRRALHVGRFGNSYRVMLEKRPRVRAGGGIYVMKYSQIKKIQRDMWTEVPVGAILEMTYYRYIYFLEDGRVLYALTPTAPHQMIRQFRQVCLYPHEHEDHPIIVWGTYEVHKTQVIVHAKQPWQYVQLHLTIQPQYLYHGRWGYLSFDKHMSSTSNNFDDWSLDRVMYEVPEEPFRFVRDKRL